MTNSNVYRVVKINGNDVTWCSDTICLTKESARNMADEMANNEKLVGNKVEEADGHKWESVALNELGKDSWVTFEKLYKVTNNNGFAFYGFTYYIGFITYKAV